MNQTHPRTEGLNLVWSVSLLDWVEMTQPGGSGPGGSVEVTNFPATQAVSAVALPLPSGAATGAKQDTGNASLASLDGKAPALVSGRVPVDGSGVTQPVSGPLTDTQLRTSPVPVSGTVATGGLTDTELRASAVPVSLATAPTTPVTNAGLTNLDVLLSTRTKPADQQHVIIDTIPTTAVTNAGLTNLDVALSTRLKAADTLAGVTTVGAVTSITNPVAVTGPLTDAQLRASAVPISADALPLPTGAALEAGNLATLAAKDYATQTTLALLTLAQGALASGVLGPLMQAMVSESPSSYLDGVVQPLSMTSEGRLRVSAVQSYYDHIWGTTFNSPWGEVETPSVGAIGYPSTGEAHV